MNTVKIFNDEVKDTEAQMAKTIGVRNEAEIDVKSRKDIPLSLEKEQNTKEADFACRLVPSNNVMLGHFGENRIWFMNRHLLDILRPGKSIYVCCSKWPSFDKFTVMTATVLSVNIFDEDCVCLTYSYDVTKDGTLIGNIKCSTTILYAMICTTYYFSALVESNGMAKVVTVDPEIASAWADSKGVQRRKENECERIHLEKLGVDAFINKIIRIN